MKFPFRPFAPLLIVLCSLSIASWSPPAAADGVAALKRFVAETRSARGEFVQEVITQSGRTPQQARGEFAFSRPGLFRWEYSSPYPQLLVGDGERLWSYDPELAQATVQAMGDALGNSPAAILAGEGALENNFELENAGRGEDGTVWVDARARQGESSFSAIRLGLRDGQLRLMELRDNFGQTTLLEFIRFEATPRLDESLFRFEPPAGVDVIGQ